jgi:hypothetical protein
VGKTYHEGHGFSRAIKFAMQMRALAPEVRRSPTVHLDYPGEEFLSGREAAEKAGTKGTGLAVPQRAATVTALAAEVRF